MTLTPLDRAPLVIHLCPGADDLAREPAWLARWMAQTLLLIRRFEQSIRAAEELAAEGIEAEVIDLRTLDPVGTDYALIGRSLEKTGALVIAEQAPACGSLGPRIAAECQRRFFDSFDCPPGFVAAPDVPLPVSRRLEQACIPTVADITAAARAAAHSSAR